jgi:hypothetical protein
MGLALLALCPFAFKILFSILLNIFRRSTKKETTLSYSSQFFGGIFSALWSGSYLVILIILIGLIPIKFAWLEKIQEDVAASKSYDIIHRFMDNKAPAASGDIKKLTAIIENPAQLQQFRSTKEFEALMEDDDLTGILSDEETAEQIRNKDYKKLLANPKIQSLMQNEQLLKKMFALNRKIMEEGLEDGFSSANTESQPKVIGIK